MTTDDLKAALDDLSRSTDGGRASAAPHTGEARRRAPRARPALWPLHWTLWWEAMWACVVIALLAWFLATHTASPWSAIGSATLLLACEIAYLVATVRQLGHLFRVDFAAPVVVVQRRLVTLWALRSRTVLAVFLVGPLVWLPLLIVAGEWLAGLDVLALASPAWVAANLAIGVAVLGGGLWVAHRPPGWVQRSARLRRIADSLAGRTLRRALDHAAEAAAFEGDAAA